MHIDKKYLFIFLPFTCFIIGYFASNLMIGNKTYITPKLIGLSLYDAIKLTSPHQINIRIISEKECANISAGTILSQKPSPGRAIKTHQPICVTTTKAAPDIIAPQLLQQPQESIEKACSQINVKCKTYGIEYPAPSNSCIAQLPQPGDTVVDKKMIIYCAKDKQNMFLMPDLTNQALDQTLESLKDYTDKISVFNGSQKLTSPYQPNAKVVAQKPLAGSLISIKPPLTIQLEICW